MSRASVIPDRWTDYLPVGKQIEGTRFICFKVPLRPSVSKHVEEKDRLDYDSLLKAIPNLGLIIDLTDTFRYYDPQVFERKGLKYKKIRIPGKMVPNNYVVEVFKKHVRDYLGNNKNKDKLIGVHCTHGVNRTGYLVCNYMISVMTLNPEDAINKFDAARGHNIERKNYLAALRKLDDTTYNQRKMYKTKKPKIFIDRSARNDLTDRMQRTNSFGRDNYFNAYEDRWNGSSSRRRQRDTCDRRSHYNENPFQSTSNGHCSFYGSKERSDYNNYENARSYKRDRRNNRNKTRYDNRDDETWKRCI